MLKSNSNKNKQKEQTFKPKVKFYEKFMVSGTQNS